MINAVICAKSGKCIKMKWVTLTMAEDFVCKECVEKIKGIVKPEKGIIF